MGGIMGKDYHVVLTELFNRVAGIMKVGREGIRLEEWDSVHLFWDSLKTEVDDKRFDSLTFPMLEEALVLRILTHRLLYELQDIDEDTKEVSVAYKSGAVGWLKTQERFRLVMKEVLKRYTASTANKFDCLAAIMAPILEQSEGVLEDAVEFEARKKSAQKKRAQQGRNRRVDSPS